MNVYSERDYFRSIDLINGNLIWHGSELSGGGFSPGPFFYYLIGLPTYFFGYSGLIALEIGLLSLGMVCLWQFLNLIYNPRLAWIALFILLNSNVVIFDLISVWNPSFIFFFWVVLAISLVLTTDRVYGRIAWPIFCVTLGLTGQIHVLTFFWFLLPIIYFSRKTISTRKLLSGLGIIFLIQMPFIIWYTMNRSQFTLLPPLQAIQNKNSILEYLFFVFGLNLGHVEKSIIISSVQKFFDYKTIAVFIGIFIFSFFTVEPRSPSLKITKWALLSAFLLAFGSLIANSMSHYYIPFIGLLIYYCYLVHIGLPQKKRNVFESIIFATYFIISLYLLFSNQFIFSLFPWTKMTLIFAISAAAALFYKDKKILFLFLLLAFSIQTQVIDHNLQIGNKFLFPKSTAEKIAAIIYENTGWEADEMKKRVLFLPQGGAKSLVASYHEHVQNRTANVDTNATGYIVAIQPPNLEEGTKGNYNWINWVNQKQIKITKEDVVDGNLLLKYEKLTQLFPNKIQNHGEAYPRQQDNYAKQFQGFKRYSVPTYDSQGPNFFIYWDESAKEVILFSHELAVTHSMGPGLFLSEPTLTFLCNSQLKSISMPNIGFPPHRSYYTKVEFSVLAPVWYLVSDCSEFKPIKFTAKKLFLMGRRAEPNPQNRVLTAFDFEYTF